MPTSISDLWVPPVWVKGLAEQVRVLPGIMNSGIAVRNTEFDGFASGGGTVITLPYFRDITDQADAIQVENTAPTKQVIGSGKQYATILNRETANNANALAAAVSGENPVDEILAQLATRRLKQRQTTLLNIMRGLFANASAPNAASGALQANRSDYFLEAGASPAAGQLIDSTKVITSLAKLGDLRDTVQGGAILMHPNIEAALLVADATSFKELSINPGLVLRTYKGLKVFTSQLLVRAGTTSGFVYDTYIFATGTVAWGEKPQVGDKVDSAALSFWEDKDLNVSNIYDRTRFLLHVNGTKWTGTPAGQSATNAELATFGNWGLDYATADRVGIIAIRSNG